MTGILLLLGVVAWLAFVIWLSIVIARRFSKAWWRIFVGMLIFAALLPLPLLDEIVGGRQFSRLCEANVVNVNKDAIKGQRVYIDIGPHQLPVPGLWVTVFRMPFRFVDATTKEVLVSFDQLQAKGGLFFPGFDSGHDPLTFNGECHPSGVFDENFTRDLGLTRVERPPSK